MLNEHRGEAEFDFLAILHISFMDAAADEDSFWRLVRQLLRDPGTRLAAAVAGWERPVSTEAFLLASIWSSSTGQVHPLMPDLQDRSLSDVETRLADLALENMNRR